MFDYQPTLESERLQLRPLNEADFAPLLAAASDPQIWAQHSDRTRYQRERFTTFFADSLAGRGTVVIIDRSTQQIIGSSRFYDFKPEEPSIIIGYTFLQRAYWGGSYNAELKRLMFAHAKQWATYAYFQVSTQNLRAQKALEKLGARFDREETVMVFGEKTTRWIYKIAL